MGQAVSGFFTATVVDFAKAAWASVVRGVNTFASWLGQEVMSFVTSVINGITTIVGQVRDFFINVWHNVEEFTRRIFPAKANVKDWLWTKTYEIGDGIRNEGIKHMRERLKALTGIEPDSLTDDQVIAKWKEYMSQHPLTPEEQNDLDGILEPTSDPNNRMISSTREYSTLRSLSTTGPFAQESEEIKLRKDKVITHLTLVLLSPEQFRTGLPQSARLAPDEEQELYRILSL